MRAIDLTGKTAIVTGGGQGLGEADCLALGGAGAQVVVADINAETAQRTADAVMAADGAALAVRTDIGDPASIRALVDMTAARYGGVDILVNNAAIYPSRPWHEVPADEWDTVFQVNVRGYLLCAQACYPHMKAKGYGKIINMASTTPFVGFPLLAAYASSKAAVIGLTRVMARELGPHNIIVNAVAPGAFPTPSEQLHADPAAFSRWITEQQCLKRRGRPSELADAVLFLASPLSDFITGQTLSVDGGWVHR